MTKRGGAIIFCRILAPPSISPDATILIYLNDREGAPLSFVEFERLPNAPPPHSPDTTILIYLNCREGAPLSFVGFWRPPPLPQTPQYLTILMTERGRHYVCRILAPPMPPPLPRRHNT